MYLVYKTVNLVTEEYYIGVHKYNPKYPYYLGSGLRIKRSIKKYGRDNFQRETLCTFETASEAFEKEKELVNEHLNNPKCLNLTEGGKGGAHFAGKKHSETSKLKIAEKLKNRTFHRHVSKDVIEMTRQTRYEKNGGQWFSEETRKKIGARSRAGRIWITDGSCTRAILKDDPIPEGFRKGRNLRS